MPRHVQTSVPCYVHVLRVVCYSCCACRALSQCSVVGACASIMKERRTMMHVLCVVCCACAMCGWSGAVCICVVRPSVRPDLRVRACVRACARAVRGAVGRARRLVAGVAGILGHWGSAVSGTHRVLTSASLWRAVPSGDSGRVEKIEGFVALIPRAQDQVPTGHLDPCDGFLRSSWSSPSCPVCRAGAPHPRARREIYHCALR